MSLWRHRTAGTAVLAGNGALDAAAAAIATLEVHRAFVVTSPSARAGAGARLLREAVADKLTIVGTFDRVRQHAPEEDVATIAARLAETNADVVVAIGGASVGDTAKGAVLLRAGGELEIDMSGLQPGARPRAGVLPIVGVPTTLAGAEFMPGGAIMRDGRKRFFVAAGLAHRITVYDPRAFADVPAEVLTTTGMNALAHAIESSYTPAATPYSRALATAAARGLAQHLPARARGDVSDETLEGLADAAILAILSYTVGGPALHHSICHVLGGAFGIPHGASNAAVLPYVVAANEPFSRDVQADLAAALCVDGTDGKSSLAENVRTLQELIGQPATLAELGIREEDLDGVADELIAHEPVTGSNPRPVERQLVVRILRAAWAGDLGLITA